MKLSHLITQREALLRRTHLSNLAFAYRQLDTLIARLDRAQLRGLVCLQPRDPAADRYWPVLTALEGSQSVIEEHFTDGDVADLADLLTFGTGRDDAAVDFRLEELGKRFLAPLRSELLRAGVQLEHESRSQSAPGKSDHTRA
jgi:hypothetical protein